jgi:hypothetical protein
MLPPDFEDEKRQASPPQGQRGPARGSNSRRPDERFPRDAGPVMTLPAALEHS